MTDTPPQANPWTPGTTTHELDFSASGRSNVGWGTIDTAHQKLGGGLRATSYKLPGKQHDYYSLYGHMSQGVKHGDGDYNPSLNWVSVGYYCTLMSLVLELVGNDGTVWDAGPTSTVGSNTTTFSIGGNLSATGGDFDTVSAGVNMSCGSSFSSPDGTIGQAVVGNSVRWDVKLPGVGFVSPGRPANPEQPAYAGYAWTFGAIFELPKGADFSFRAHPRAVWEFDYTRGITIDTKTWEIDKVFSYKGS